MASSMGDCVESAINFLLVLLAIFVPLGLWKLIDLIIYAFGAVGE